MKREYRTWVMLVVFSVFIFQGLPITDALAESPAGAPLKVVVVSGTNYEMGVQYGEQAADLIAGNRDAINELLETRVCTTTRCAWTRWHQR